jgi:hypothetical protein
MHLEANLAVLLSVSKFGLSSTISMLTSFPVLDKKSNILKANSGENPKGEGALTPGA